jgi:hypothetical protein
VSSSCFGVFTNAKISKQTCVLQEVASVPWTCDNIWSETLDASNKPLIALLLILKTAEGIQCIKSLNGLHPRTFQEIPQMALLTDLRSRVRVCLPSAQQDEVDEVHF